MAGHQSHFLLARLVDVVNVAGCRVDLPGERDARILWHLRRLHLRQVLRRFHALAAEGRRGWEKRAELGRERRGMKKIVVDFGAETVRVATKRGLHLPFGWGRGVKVSRVRTAANSPPPFGSGLRENRGPESAADRYRAALDDTTRSNRTVRTYTGGLRISVGDAVTLHAH